MPAIQKGDPGWVPYPGEPDIPPPNQKKPHKVRNRVIAGVSVFVVAAVAAGVASSATSSHPAMSPPRPAATAPATPLPVTSETTTPVAPPTQDTFNAPIGSTLDLKDSDTGAHWKVTVNSAVVYHPGQYDNPAGAGYHYIRVNVTYRAIAGTASPNPFDWESKEANGQTHDVEYLGDSNTMLNSNDISAGQKTTGDVFLKVPDASKGTTVVYTAGSTEQASWDVSGI